jgi:hypothetical protein
MDSAGKTYFRDRYNTYSDIQILEILQNHLDYQDDAVRAVVEIAIERGLIESKDDLLRPEYQKHAKNGFTLFPEIHNHNSRKRLISGISRILYLFSAIPIVSGIMNYGKGDLKHTGASLGIGMAWLFFFYLYQKTNSKFSFLLLYGILIIAASFIFLNIFSSSPILYSDIFVSLVGILMPAYFIFFLKKLKEN